ncbi:MAG TPA: hypothetical protein VF477_11865 [Mycobacterium sp.]
MRYQALSVIAAAVAAYALSAPAISAAAYPACQNRQVDVGATAMSPGAGHRGVELEFSLDPNSAPCTLAGYLGGAPGRITTVTLGPRHGTVAVVEGVGVDDNGDQCPTYTDLLVTPPNTTQATAVAATIDTCTLQVHPVQ